MATSFRSFNPVPAMSLLNYQTPCSVIAATTSYLLLAEQAMAQTRGGVMPFLPMPIINLISYILLLAFAVLAVIWWRKGKRPATIRTDAIVALDDGFSITPGADGKSIRFAIRGSGIGIGAWFGFILGGLFFGTILTALIAISYKMKDAASLRTFLLMMAFALGSAFLWSRVRRQKFVFEISEGVVRAPDGQTYARGDISEILIRNQGSVAHSAAPQSTTIIAGTGLTGVAMAGATAMGNAAAGVGNAIGQSVAQSIAKRGNEVCIRHGRKVIPLARYLREDDAIALFNKVRELL